MPSDYKKAYLAEKSALQAPINDLKKQMTEAFTSGNREPGQISAFRDKIKQAQMARDLGQEAVMSKYKLNPELKREMKKRIEPLEAARDAAIEAAGSDEAAIRAAKDAFKAGRADVRSQYPSLLGRGLTGAPPTVSPVTGKAPTTLFQEDLAKKYPEKFSSTTPAENTPAGLSIPKYNYSPETGYTKQPGMKKGGKVKGYKSGGMVSSASKRGDGCAIKGKTKGRMV